MASLSNSNGAFQPLPVSPTPPPHQLPFESHQNRWPMFNFGLPYTLFGGYKRVQIPIVCHIRVRLSSVPPPAAAVCPPRSAGPRTAGARPR